MTNLVAVGEVLTDIKVETAAGAAQTNVPISLAQPFKIGALPASGAAVDLFRNGVTVPCQIDVKATHADGSVRHAVLNAIMPTVSTGAAQVWSIRRAAAGSAAVPPVPSEFAALNAVVTLVDTGNAAEGPNAGTTYTAELAPQMSAAQFETYLSGDVCADWRIMAPLKTAGGAVHPDLQVIFDVRVFKGQSRAKIDFIVENGKVKKNPGGGSTWDPTIGVTQHIYRVSLSVAGTTVYTRANKGFLYTTLENRDGSNNIIGVSGGNSTGLPNTATAYTATFTIDGNITRNLSIIGSQAQTYDQLCALINTQFAGSATVTPAPGSQGLRFEAANMGGSILLSNPGTLFPALDHVRPNRPIFGNEYLHFVHHGWKKTFWWGGEPQVHVRHNRTYLEDSKAVPKYQEDLTGSMATINGWVAEMAAPGDLIGANGITYPYMPAQGYAPGIGVLPSWGAMWVVNQGPEIKKLMLQMGDLYGSWPMVYRDADTGKPVKFETYPMATISPNGGDSFNPATNLQEKFPTPIATPQLAGSINVPDVPHHPCFCYGPYLATGDHFYLDGLQMQQRWTTLVQNPQYRQGRKGLAQDEQPRGQAWMLRTLLQTAYITPDAHPLKADLQYQVAANADWYNTAYVSSTGAYHNNIGVVYHGYGTPYNDRKGGAGWMDGFLTSAVGLAMDFGYVDFAPFFHFKTKWVVGLLTAPPPACWQWFGMYAFNWRTVTDGPIHSDFTGVWNGTFDNDAETRNAACGTDAMRVAIAKYEGGRVNVLNTTSGYPDQIGGYVANAQGAVAYAASYSATGGEDAWLVYSSNALKPDYNEGPQFAIVPRIAEGTAPDPDPDPDPTPTPDEDPMAIAVADRTKETTSTTGTASFVLTGPVDNNYQAFFPAIAVGKSTPYSATGRGTGQWENGWGTLSAQGVLDRSIVTASSNGGELVNFVSPPDVACDITAALIAKFARVDEGVDIATLPDFTVTAGDKVVGVRPSTGTLGLMLASTLGSGTGPAPDTTAPSAPTNLASSAVTQTAFTITFTPGNDNVAVGRSEWSLDGATWTAIGTATSFTVTGRTPGTAHTVRVRTVDTSGNVSTAATLSVTTAAASGDNTAPSMSGSITVSGQSESGYTFSYTAGSDNVAVDHYETSIDGGASWATNGLNLSRTVTGRPASTTDQVRVRAHDAAGNISNVLTGTATTSAAAPTTAYTVTGYNGNTLKTTEEIGNRAVYSGKRQVLPATTGTSPSYPIYYNVNAVSGGAMPASCKAGWSTSSTVPPDASNTAYLGGNNDGTNVPINVYVNMNKGVAFDIDPLTLWVPVGTPNGTQFHLWFYPSDGSPILVGSMAVTGA